MTGESRSKYFIDMCRSCSYPLKVLQLTLRDKLGNISTAEDAAPPHLRARWYRSCRLRPRMLIEDFISYCSLPKSYLSPQVYFAIKFSSGVLPPPPKGLNHSELGEPGGFSTWAVTSVSPHAPPSTFISVHRDLTCWDLERSQDLSVGNFSKPTEASRPFLFPLFKCLSFIVWPLKAVVKGNQLNCCRNRAWVGAWTSLAFRTCRGTLEKRPSRQIALNPGGIPGNQDSW